jgi:hypothetical protein
MCPLAQPPALKYLSPPSPPNTHTQHTHTHTGQVTLGVAAFNASGLGNLTNSTIFLPNDAVCWGKGGGRGAPA